MAEIYLVIIQAKKDELVFNSNVECFSDYNRAKEYVNKIVAAQKYIETTCDVVDEYDYEVDTFMKAPFINGWLTKDILYAVKTRTTCFNETVYMDRMIIKQTIKGTL